MMFGTTNAPRRNRADGPKVLGVRVDGSGAALRACYRAVSVLCGADGGRREALARRLHRDFGDGPVPIRLVLRWLEEEIG